eukprot:scaffold40247_cov65-Phaeocystis_antarctica.AAC.3
MGRPEAGPEPPRAWRTAWHAASALAFQRGKKGRPRGQPEAASHGGELPVGSSLASQRYGHRPGSRA